MECGYHSNRQQEELDRIADMLGHSVTSKTQVGIAGCTASSRDGREGDEGGRDVEGCGSFTQRKNLECTNNVKAKSSMVIANKYVF